MYWKYVDDLDTSTCWNWRLSFWRLELQLSVHRHTYPDNPNLRSDKRTYISGDRWVFKPHLIYDRKSKPPHEELLNNER